jgi:predicted  nucleic acid-binding Zn-ribbon protein
MDEQRLQRHLEEAHRQLLERDNVYRFHEEELQNRELQIEELEKQIVELRTWAAQLESSVRRLEGTIREMEATAAWRVSNRVRLWKESARSIAHRDPRP